MRNVITLSLLLAGICLSNIRAQDTTLVNISLAARRHTDSLIAVSYYNKAVLLFSSGLNDSAYSYTGRSAEIAAGRGFLLTEAMNFELIARIKEYEGIWEESLQYYLKAGIIYSKAGDLKREAGIMRILGNNYFRIGLYEKAAWYFEREYLLYNQQSIADKANAAENTAISKLKSRNDTSAIRWFRIAHRDYLIAGDNNGIRRCNEKLGSLCLLTGDYESAEEVFRDLLKDYESVNEMSKVSMVHYNLGMTIFKSGDTEGALSEFLKASEIAEKNGKSEYLLTDIWSNIAVCQNNINRQREMLESLNRALVFAESSNRDDEVARLSHLLAVIYFRQGDNYHAEQYCIDCIEAAKQTAAPEILMQCYETLSDVLENGNDFVNALAYYEKFLSLRDSIIREEQQSTQSEAVRQSEYETIERNIRDRIADEEIRGLELKTLRADSISKENELKFLLKQQDLDRAEKMSLANSLEIERQKTIVRDNRIKLIELERDRLNQQQRLDRESRQNDSLQTENRVLELEKQQQERMAESEKQKRKLAIWLGVLMVIVAFMILLNLISARRKNIKLQESKREIEKINSDLEVKNREVLLQKDIIEQKNQSITDSIQYASRIQTAVLPPFNFLDEWGYENFILFRPKDIVSGDFYWGIKRGMRTIVAVADCTGHGVPGAFMSMLGHAFLDEILNTTEVNDAAHVLNLLREGIINTLKQKGNIGETRDGMDISLCIIDPGKMRLDYAGANNPAYLIRNNRLYKYEADRMPIGIHHTGFTPFTNHSIEIKKDDHLYLFSDGYADQFGGPNGKKYMYKPFQQLLLNIHSKPMNEQREVLNETLIQWMGKYEQVDDVLVLGMKL